MARNAKLEDRTLLSLANWADMPAPPQTRPNLLAALAEREAAMRRDAPVPPAAPAAPVRTPAAAGPTLFDLLQRQSAARLRDNSTPAAPRPVPQGPAAAPGAAGRRPALWLLPPLLALAGGLAGAMLAGSPQYGAKAELILKPGAVRAAPGAVTRTADRPEVPQAAVEHSMGRVAAPEVLGAVVDRLSLASDPEFGGGRDAAVSTLARRLTAAPQRLTPGYTVTAVAGSAALSGEIANAVADALVETHDPLAAGPPPAMLEVAYRAMPGVAGPVSPPLLGAGIGAAAGGLAGLIAALLAGRLPRRASPRPAVARAMPATSQVPAPSRAPTRTAAPARAADAPRVRPAVPAAAPAGRRRRTALPVEPPPPQATPEATLAAGLRRRLLGGTVAKARAEAKRTPPAPAPAPAASTHSSSPTLTDPAMYPQHPYLPQQHATPAQPAMQQPVPAYWPQPVGWPQPVAAPPAVPVQHYPQPMVMMPQPVAAYPHPAHALPQPVHVVPPYAPLVYAPPPAPAAYAPMHQPAQVPQSAPAPHSAEVYVLPAAPAFAGQAPARPEPAPAPQFYPTVVERQAVERQIDETQTAIDEVRAQLRAFAGTLDALRAARSA